MPDRENAAIYIPDTITDPAEFATLAAPCLERIEACGYALRGIVRRWGDVLDLMRDGRVHVTIVADVAHIPRDCSPRIELAHDPVRPRSHCVVPPETVMPPKRLRRPRRITR